MNEKEIMKMQEMFKEKFMDEAMSDLKLSKEEALEAFVYFEMGFFAAFCMIEKLEMMHDVKGLSKTRH